MSAVWLRPPPRSPPLPEKRTVKELRDACKALALSSNGKKDALVKRLVSHTTPDFSEWDGDTPSQVEDDAVAAAATSGTRSQAPMFIKHEFARLLHVLALPAVATAVIAIRGPLTRQQKDAREDKVDVWATTVSDHFNSDARYDVPAACAHLGLDPSVHPHHRAGDKLKAKFQEVSVPRNAVLFCISCSLILIYPFLTNHMETTADETILFHAPGHMIGLLLLSLSDLDQAAPGQQGLWRVRPELRRLQYVFQR